MTNLPHKSLNFSAGAASGPSLKYFIAQHVPDVMRKETKNIGVLVQKGDDIVARFYGEREDSTSIDRRSLRGLTSPDIYRMWIRHWRKALESPNWYERLSEEGYYTFSIVQGGEVTAENVDASANDVCAYLYHMLVSDAGLKAAIPLEDASDVALRDLRTEVTSVFRELNLIASVTTPVWLRHPIYTDRELSGAKYKHQVSYYQAAHDEAWVFEPINFITSQKKSSKERAGYLAHVFEDFRNASTGRNIRVNPTAIVRVSDDERNDILVDYSLGMLREYANLVDWLDQDQRKQFLSERERIATAA